MLLVFAKLVVDCRLDRFHGLDCKHLLAAVEKEIGWLARTRPTESVPAEAAASQVNEKLSPGLFRSGTGWLVQFQGEQAVLKDMVGIGQLQQLLASPHTPISAATLDGIQESAPQTVQPIADTTAIHQMQQELKELEGDLSEPSYPMTSDTEEALCHRRDQIKDELNRAGALGRLRPMKSEQSSSINRVRAALKRAIDHVSGALPELGQHLDNSLRDINGANPCYYPASPVVWRVNS